MGRPQPSAPTRGTPGIEGSKAEGKRALADTSGKGGTPRHAVGLMDPQGVRIKSFTPPTEEERRHDFLWRIRA